ncbi:MAG: fasciclin domain-containing protein [Niabella sp.]
MKSCITGISLFIIIMVCFFSCKKIDTTYVDYQNTLGEYDGTALQYLQSQTGLYDSFLLAVSRVDGLEDTLSTEAITLFAVSNRSFTLALESINAARKDSTPEMEPVSISTIDVAALDTFLCRYILRGKIYSDSLLTSSDGLILDAVKYSYEMNAKYVSTNASGFVGGGPRQITFSDRKNSIFERYWVSVNTITTDISTTNAVINVLPPGHSFGFGSDFLNAVNKR